MMYNQVQTQDTSLVKLIELHKNLIETNKTIEKAIPDAEAVCNLQAQWQWNCKSK